MRKPKAIPPKTMMRTIAQTMILPISWRLRVFPNDGERTLPRRRYILRSTRRFAGSVVLESSNYPGWFLRHRGNELWVDHDDGTATFDADSSFAIRTPLTG